jgi:choline dehydrogenase-like flavoprotein
MILDSTDVRTHEPLSTDVCILGGGVAGLTLARELLGTGREVLVVEQAGWEKDRTAQKALRGRSVGYPYWGLEYVRRAQVGGTSHDWFLGLGPGEMGGRFRPMDAIDFEAREEIPHSGWPFGLDHLTPYYDRAQRLLQLGPSNYDASFWAPDEDLLLPESDLLQTVVFQFGNRRTFAEEYPAELADSETVTILTHAHVHSLSTLESGRSVSAVNVRTPEGGHFQIQANVFVLALGGIENARTLLLSNDRRSSGLGNEHDLVGRYFMEHPHFLSGKLWPADPSVFDRDDFYVQHERQHTMIQGKFALREDVLRRERLRNFCFSLVPTADPEDTLYRSAGWDAYRVLQSHLCKGDLPARPLRELLTMVGRGAPLVHHLVRQKRAQLRRWRGQSSSPVAYQLHFYSEQAPNPASRVRLSDVQVDPYGQPVAELDLQFQPEDVADVLRGQQLIKEAVERNGLGTFEPESYDRLPPPGIKGGFHHMGTTRMHESPRWGVVDPDSRVHGLSNLYVAGSSVFPTGGYANPTLTICAMTLRLADHLKDIGNDRVADGHRAVGTGTKSNPDGSSQTSFRTNS